MRGVVTTTHYRTCPLCEATCGLEIETDQDHVVSIRGDAEDVFSQGFICPKAYSLKELHGDPDRLRTPLRRRADGTFEGELIKEITAFVTPEIFPRFGLPAALPP